MGISNKKVALVIVFLIVLGAFSVLNKKPDSTEISTPSDSSQTISDGSIRFSYSPTFGLATTVGQILASSYIPPCDEEFTYCFYYLGTEYENTNFDSAGLRIERRNDLNTMDACLNTPPRGYTNMTPRVLTREGYQTSFFDQIGNAGAGHYSEGALYRLSVDNYCYEFETRIAFSQFANYESGTIEEFTNIDKSSIHEKIKRILDTLYLVPTEIKIYFPN
jgi:hypothetical protein